MRRNLGIVFFKKVNLDLGDFLLEYLKYNFKDVFTEYEFIKEPINIPIKAHDQNRDQYLASPLLELLRVHALENDFYKVLGITRVDLYSKTMNFIFGKAEFGNRNETRAAIISLYRLKSGLNLDSDDKLTFFKRILKETIHEIGHSLHFFHCNNECVMNFSNSIEKADEKPLTFCKACKARL